MRRKPNTAYVTIYAGQFTLLFEVLEGDLFLVLIMIMIIDYIIL